MNINPLRRSPIKKKSKAHKESAPWRRPKVRLNGGEMKALRHYVYERSGGQCENSFYAGEKNPRYRCPVQISWWTMELAHIESRGRGGSDTKENVLAACRDCHFEDTRNRKKLVPHKDWIA